MKVTDIVKWNLESGKEIEARIEITREVQLEKTVWVDQEITLPCYEMYENNEITCWVDDKCVARGNSLIVVRPQNSKYYAPRTIGAIGKVCLRQPAYDAVKTAYDSAIAEVEANADVIAYRMHEKAVIAKRTAAQNEIDAYDKRMRDCGCCEKCGTWCYGSCEVN